MRDCFIYRINKFKGDGPNRRVAPGVGKRLALHFHPQMGATGNVLTSVKPKNKIPERAVIINYGRSKIPEWEKGAIERRCLILNDPRAVALAVNKTKTLSKLSEMGVPALKFTTKRAEAIEWLASGEKVIVRATPVGKMGKGVSLCSPGQDLPDAPLYTGFYDKTHEFRVHVVGGKVIDYVQKKRMGKEKLKNWNLTEANDLVRNHARGWVFARKNIYEFDMLKKLAMDATYALGLDFAGVDILARISNGGRLLDAVVCEVNSAPGMSDKNTFNAYTEAFRRYLV